MVGGASTVKPKISYTNEVGAVSNFNFDNQLAELGDIGTNEITDCFSQKTFVSKKVSGTFGRPTKTDSNGLLWIFTGVQSGFGGRTTIYIENMSITWIPVA